MNPSLGTNSEFCKQLSIANNAIVIDADYRKAPEYPHPACLHDAEDVVGWVLGQSFTDKAELTLVGFSAGGTIALVLAASNDILPIGTVKHVITFHVVVDISKGNLDERHRHAPKGMPGQNNGDFAMGMRIRPAASTSA